MIVKSILGIFILLTTVSSCTNSKSDSTTSNSVYANLTTAGAGEASQNLTLTLKEVAECYHDSNSGFVRLMIGASSTSAPFLSVKIKGYTSTAKTYNCTQTANNKGAGTSVGDYYDNCGVTVGLYTNSAGAAVNQYATYRETTSVQALDYAGTCTVNITEVSPTIRGTISCGQMVQSYLNGAPVNPVNNSTVLNLTGDFYCSFGQNTLSKMQEGVDQSSIEFEETEFQEEIRD